jgi:hypothetical protein
MMLVHLEVILMITMAIATISCLYLNLVLHQQKYAHHVVFDQPTKVQKKLLERPYIYFLGILLFVILYSWFLANYLEDDGQQFAFGLFISLLSIILGQAIGGILIFLYAIKNPEKIAGQTIFKDKKILALHSQAVFMPCLILLISLVIIHPAPFILGSLVAAIIMSLITLVQFLLTSRT